MSFLGPDTIWDNVDSFACLSPCPQQNTSSGHSYSQCLEEFWHIVGVQDVKGKINFFKSWKHILR